MMAMPIPHTGLFVRRRKPKFPIGAYDDYPRRNPWSLLSRAWVCQERRQSPNFIHLAKEQLYWECKTCLISEDGSESYYSQELPGTYTHGFKMGSSDPELDWRKVVERYSRLDITYDSDRLSAISAVVQRLQPLRDNDTYVMGMWTNSVLEEMTWSIHSLRPDPPRPRTTGKYPTWSWLSVKQGVVFELDPSPLLSVQLTHANYTITGPAHIDYAEDARLTLTGPSITVEFSGYDRSSDGDESDEDDYTPFSLGRDFNAVRDAINYTDQRVDFDYRTAESPMSAGEKLTLVLLTNYEPQLRWTGIVLRPVGQDAYERVGWIQLEAGKQNHNRSREEQQECFKSLDKFLQSLPLKQFTIV